MKKIKIISMLREMDKYLSGNPLNSIRSGSIFHRKIKEVLKVKNAKKLVESEISKWESTIFAKNVYPEKDI